MSAPAEAPADLVQYCQYVRNTGMDPLPTAFFDDDWEPVGPLVRPRLVNAGLITDDETGIRLTDAGEAAIDG